MQQLLSDVGSSPGTPAALAFLANVLKDNGAVQQAVQLFQKAVQLQPDCSSFALGMAHCLELQYDYAGVLKVVLGYCAACGLKQLGPLQLKVSRRLRYLFSNNSRVCMCVCLKGCGVTACGWCWGTVQRAGQSG